MRKLNLLIVVTLCMSFSQLFAAPGDIIWTKTYESDAEQHPSSLTKTSDGGYIIGGYTGHYGVGTCYDGWLVKTDANCDTIWTRTYGGDSTDVVNWAEQTSDGGYFAVGYTKTYGAGQEDAWLIKTDSNGDSLWTKTYGGWNHEYIVHGQQTSDGGYILTGYTYSFGTNNYSDVWLLKTDQNGDTLWTKTYGDSTWESGDFVRQTADGGYLIGATAFWDTEDCDMWLIRTDANGDTLWTRTYGDDDYRERLYSLDVTSDGGYIMTSQTHDWYEELGSDLYIVRTDSNGDSLWSKTYSKNEYFVPYSIKQTTDGGYAVTGYTGSNDPYEFDIFVLKTDANGDTLWSRTYDRDLDDYGINILETDDGELLVLASIGSFDSSTSNPYFLKLNAYELLCDVTITTPRVPSNGGNLGFDINVTNYTSNTIAQLHGEIHPTIGDCASGTPFDFDNYRVMTSDLTIGESYTGYYYMTMGNWSNLPNQVALGIEVGDGPNSYMCDDCGEFFFQHHWYRGGQPSWTNIKWFERGDEFAIPGEVALGQNYPNPFNATTVIPFELSADGNVILKVYNLAGQLVETLVNGYMNAGSHKAQWDASTVSSGVYFYTLETDDYTTTKKMNLLK
ncbi:MAG: T9SS type A sorting domain-containing protein [candidate division Zixibacteria bacterium]|nr:T9SS type A sorting domain-containing protein [candidate division Zixibacteria bacterium]